MKIALFTDGIYPYVIGGMQKHSFHVAKYMARNQVDVDLYHYNESGYDISKLEFFSGEEKKYIHPVVVDFPIQDKFPGHYTRASYTYSERIYAEFLKRNNVDFIYAKGFTAWKLLNEKRKNKHNFPPVGVNFHGYEMFQYIPGIRTFLEQFFILRRPVLKNAAMADYVFSYGPGITRILKYNMDIPEHKILEVPSGTEMNESIPQKISVHNPRHFLFVGRFERRKGIRELHQAISSIQPGIATFGFAGNMPASEMIKRKDVRYYGKIQDPEKTKEIYQQSDILICPSYAEGMPNVILEAMANGLAIIATDVGAVGSMVNENNGWLLKKTDSISIRNAIETAIRCVDGEIENKKAFSLKTIKERFLWNDIIQMLIFKIKDCVNG